ncbi:hypothetical protein GQ43DRAFT_242477 [Delitschia confertaspora ATCC 74209]|uniref:Uncharacterized protein n=1 Tax=Delitschia confertaspora ATCC 74209 TaxID=1513339 RepID=A0A9P4JCD8_9PLEO|nr:hypothetical protein GQ43DRAFT_242477 [Delitschia confertaspora ATCC 74209]
MTSQGLTTLSPEILSQIFSYLETENPGVKINSKRGTTVPHPFVSIAATSKYLHDNVEGYCRHLLLKNSRTSCKVTKNPKKSPNYRKKWLTWTAKNCRFCWKASVRKAILYPNITCCKECDRKEPKITMTDAIEKTTLTKLDLFTPNILYPDAPSLRKGTYMVMGAPATLFHQEDVDARVKYVKSYFEDQGGNRIEYRKGLHLMAMKFMDVTVRDGQWVPQTPYVSDPHDPRQDPEASVQEYLKFDRNAIENLKAGRPPAWGAKWGW